MSLDFPGQYFKEAEVEASEFTTESQEETENGHLFKFNASGLIVAIDSGGPLEYSFNGKDVHGKLYRRDKFIAMDDTGASRIYFRSVNGTTVKYRVWAWRRQG